MARHLRQTLILISDLSDNQLTKHRSLLQEQRETSELNEIADTLISTTHVNDPLTKEIQQG